MTSDFSGNTRNSTEIKEALRRISKAGFSHIHWCHEWTGSYLYSTHEMLQIRRWCDEFNLGIKGVHATSGEANCDLKDYVSPNDYNRLAGVELIKNRIDLAYILNAEVIVLHFNLPWKHIKEKKYWEQYLRPALKSFDELEIYCKTRNIKICIENGLEVPQIYLTRMFDTLFERYDSNYMGLCFDTGHALITCKKENCLDFAKNYNDRLFMIHVHDNQGEKDEHLIPFEGGFDWEGFAPILARSPYRFPILLESTLRAGIDDDSSWLNKAFESGNRFFAMVEKYRDVVL